MKLTSKRRGKTGQIQQEIYDALLPVIQKHEPSKHGTQENDRFWGLVNSSVGDIRLHAHKFRNSCAGDGNWGNL